MAGGRLYDALKEMPNKVLDEALKGVGYEQFCSKVLGGVISDQKICKPCPHRYTRQEPCSVIPVDVKNYSNLINKNLSHHFYFRVKFKNY